MRVVFTTLRNTSHFLPLIPFVEACLRRGHEVGVAAPEDLRERATATGATFMPFGHPGDERLKPIWTRMRNATERESMGVAIGELFAGACAAAALPGLIEILASFRPAVVVRESMEFAAVIAAEKVDLPHVRVSITGRHREKDVFALATPALDTHRGGLGLAPDPGSQSLEREPVLSLFPACLDAQGSADDTTRRFRAPRGEAAPLPDYWGGRAGPFVYATLGTVTGGMDAMRAAFRPVLDALVDVPARVLLTIGADLPLDALGSVPDHVHVERFVPQDQVLPHAAAIVCHGGSGTVLGALSAGVPLVVMPLFADQPMNAERVAALGAGLALSKGTAAPDQIRSALLRILDDGSFRTVAKRVSDEIAALPSVDEAGAELERLI